jgi:hypothetical protein
MAHPALLADRPGSERGLTLTVLLLLLLATMVAIGAIAFAAVHSAPGSVGNAHQSTVEILPPEWLEFAEAQ